MGSFNFGITPELLSQTRLHTRRLQQHYQQCCSWLWPTTIGAMLLSLQYYCALQNSEAALAGFEAALAGFKAAIAQAWQDETDTHAASNDKSDQETDTDTELGVAKTSMDPGKRVNEAVHDLLYALKVCKDFA